MCIRDSPRIDAPARETAILLLERAELQQLTGFAGSLDDVAVLPATRLVACEAEGHDGEHENDEEADDGEDERPAHLALADVVVVRLVAADTTHVHVVPAGREDHQPEKHQNACNNHHHHHHLANWAHSMGP